MNGAGGLFGFLVVVAVVAKFFWWLVAAALVAGVFWFLRATWRLHRAQAVVAARQRAATARRADEQHAQVLAGDERGVFGMFPPVT